MEILGKIRRMHYRDKLSLLPDNAAEVAHPAYCGYMAGLAERLPPASTALLLRSIQLAVRRFRFHHTIVTKTLNRLLSPQLLSAEIARIYTHFHLSSQAKIHF